MEIVKGVNLHLIKNESLKTVQVKCRFSGYLDKKNVARRVLVAQMLETASKAYPTNRDLRKKLASLYGASLSTNVVTKGYTHCIDIDASVISDVYSFESHSLLEELLEVFKEILFNPLITTEQYQSASFELEKQNVMAAIDTENEDLFHIADQELKGQFFNDDCQALSTLTTKELLQKENSFTAYQEFQRMLQHDQIDIFIVGDFDDYEVIKTLHQFPFKDRHLDLSLSYKQDYTNVISKYLEKKDSKQSVLTIGYHMPFTYGDKEMASIAVYNALLGELPTSKLFVNVREKKGLAYAIGSHYDSFSQLFTIYAGIQKVNKSLALRLILKQTKELRLGKFTKAEIEQAKVVLKNRLLAAQDYPKQAIELAYHSHYFNRDNSIDNLLTEVDSVNKESIVSVAQRLKLQAIYTLEGSA
ncbi:EF-P 5-aminopentanol modification-associated protein YfmF [Streptococcus thoraltensis]|uniref:EF-P 5-aminopentanol modification-associated protein YfmF n=1 Tax=Streptococcus thoraltensis TaxID=55085 RepID=UPI00037A8116|nr:pitrilysin family protein [Streptococcus thoraltensis]MDY4760747.1 pitrilysin family protein [Streptococcus thoraltensis]